MFDNIKHNSIYNCTDIVNADGTETRVYWSMGLALTHLSYITNGKRREKFISKHELFTDERELGMGDV